MDKQIYILRHGETEYNRLRIVQGSGVDTSLNEKGRAQAQAFFNHYQHIPFEVVLTSALQRSQQTVELFGNKGIPTEHFTEINEIHWGVHEGKKGNPQMVEHYKHLMDAWKSGNYDARLEEGESATELADRINRFLEQLKKRAEQKILICTHGRTLRCLMCLIKGLPISEMDSIKHRNTGLYLVHFQKGEFQVEIENDHQHLTELPSV